MGLVVKYSFASTRENQIGDISNFFSPPFTWNGLSLGITKPGGSGSEAGCLGEAMDLDVVELCKELLEDPESTI